MRRHYVAIIEQGKDGYGVFFPDLPGCASAGDTVGEAAVNAGEAAAAWVEVTAEHDEPVPDPTPLEQITVEADVREVARVLVPVDVPGGSVRLGVTMDEALARAVDAAAAARGMTRSAFLAEGARRLLREGKAPV
jgi:predicted RNase H-like HicB family nuclease